MNIIHCAELLGFDTAALTEEIFTAFGERILHIRTAHPEAARIDYFLDMHSDDLYVGLFRRLYGDELDEIKFEPLSFYQLQYYRHISGEPLSLAQLTALRKSIEKLTKTELCGNPYFTFTELLPYKLVRLGDIRGLTIPFDMEYFGASNPAEEISLRLSKTSSDFAEEYFKDEVKALSAAFSQAERALK
ncbi:MAG: hypothetical protein IJD85_00865 [Oscillospiraceae bacterium]|nr:hypothetical protein [Oscillospiraceae bacterium]